MTDVLSQEIPILNKLKDAKIRLNQEVAKERQRKAEQQAVKQKK